MCCFKVFRVIVAEPHISASYIVEVLGLNLVVQQPAGFSAYWQMWTKDLLRIAL